MRPQTVSVGSVAASAPMIMDRKQNPFNVGFGVDVSGGTLTYTVEHTFSDILAGVTAVWFPHSPIAAQTTNKDGNYAFPVTAIRLNVTAFTSGPAVMTVLQGSSQ